ncbi:MAG: ketoacyl-ACP synthase III [Spirochaetota bacterium]
MTSQNIKSKGVRITGFGHYLPEKIVTNEEIASYIQFPEMRPAEKAVIGDVNEGATQRHRASETETVPFMAAEATKMALKDANVSPEEVDLFILANWTDREYIPDLAPQASKLVGSERALAFDLATACTGFVHGVQTALMYLLAGNFKKAVVVGSERFSRRTRLKGYGEYTAGDAAAAVVLEKSDSPYGIIDTFLKDYPDLEYIITCPGPKFFTKSYPDLIPNAIEYTLKAIEQMLENNSLSVDEVDWLVPHPGTFPVVKGVSQGTKIPKEKQLSNFHKVGNTSAASIPIVLSEYKHAGKFKEGDLFICPAVGGGWYSGGVVFTL